jgi:hypothetical protein
MRVFFYFALHVEDIHQFEELTKSFSRKASPNRVVMDSATFSEDSRGRWYFNVVV